MLLAAIYELLNFLIYYQANPTYKLSIYAVYFLSKVSQTFRCIEQMFTSNN